MRRVLVLVPFPMTQEQLDLRRAQAKTAQLPPDVELDYRPVLAAPSSYVSHHDYVLADMSLFEAGLEAEAEGYDAVCIDTVSDSGVAALRSMLDIPVIATGRSMFLTALMLGRSFGIVTMWKNWFPLYERILKDLVLTDRCAGMRAAGINPDNRNLLGGKEEVLPLLYDAARQLVDLDGADVVCLGSTTMHEAHAYLAERIEVPVLNGGPLSYQIAEMMTALDLTHSRRAYPKPMVAKPELIKAMMRAAAEAEPRKCQ